MRSVADIPGDDTVDDDLSGISPELVLIDPDLARLVRERQVGEPPSTALSAATLRLVEGGSVEPTVVPQPVEIPAPPPPVVPQAPETVPSSPVVPQPLDTAPSPPIAPHTVETAAPASVVPQTVETDAPSPVVPQPVENAPPSPVVPEPVETPAPPPVGSRTVETAAPSPVVPRTVESAPPPPAAPRAVSVTSSEPVVEPAREDVVPRALSASTPVVHEPVLDALPIPASEPGPVARRVIEAEPARAVPSPDVEEPAPLVPDRLADITVPPSEPTPGFSTMPHPVARPATQRRMRASAGSRKRGKTRGVIAFLVAVAVASAAVIGITRLTSQSSEGTPGKAGTAAVGAPPVATKSGSKTKAAKKAAAKKPAPSKPKPAVTKPAATQKTSGARAATKPKPTVASTPKTQASVKAKPTASKPTPAAASPKKTSAAPAAAETRRFAWAPVDGATGYHVELFRGNDRVLAKDTKEPVLEVAPSWRYQGRTVTLTPGEYRWYVWPVTSSGRGTEAVVQAKLTV